MPRRPSLTVCEQRFFANTLYKHLTHKWTWSLLVPEKETHLRLGFMKDSSSRHALLTLLLGHGLRPGLQTAQSYLARYLWLLPTSLPENQKSPIAHIILLNRRLNAQLSIHICRSTPTTTPAAAAAISKAANVPASSMSSSASTTPSLSPLPKRITCPSTWTTPILARAL